MYQTMSAREPSDAELLTKVAAAAQVVLTIPGIVDSYDPLLNTVEVLPAAVASDDPADKDELVTAQFRALIYGGFAVAAAPVSGDHVTLLGHGLDASEFLSLAPLGGAGRANLPGAGVTWEALPGRYGTTGPLAALSGLWVGTDLGTVGINITDTEVKLGAAVGHVPVVRGTEMAAWMTALNIVLAAHASGPITGPPVPATLLSPLVKTT